MTILFLLFGATGDLARRKLYPALARLTKRYDIHIICLAGSSYSQAEFKKVVKQEMKPGEFRVLNQRITYLGIDFKNIDEYTKLGKVLTELKSTQKIKQIVSYLAIPPQLFKDVVGAINILEPYKSFKCKKKIVFEKPFGEDLKSAQKLNTLITSLFEESQIYRIDHYLGKEAVKNLLTIRMANLFLEPLWNNRYVDNIQITAFEQLGIGSRAQYYDHAGAIRDMVQNHLFQMLSLIAMEPPVSLNADDVRNEKVKVLKSVKKISKNDIVLGQYDKGVINGEKVVGYKQEKNIMKSSRTETFVALKLYLETWRWHGIPFYLRTGKRMQYQGTYVTVNFKRMPGILYNKSCDNLPNKLVLEVQPDFGVKLYTNFFKEKADNIEQIPIMFKNIGLFGINTLEAYEVLLGDVFEGKQVHFTRWDGVEAAWKIVDNIINCSKHCPLVHSYSSGSLGPKITEKLIQDKRGWHDEYI